MQPVTIEERLAHISAAKAKLGTKIPWLADTMENDLKHAFGDRNNSEFIVSPEGKILTARPWSDPDKVRTELEELVGKSDTLTKSSDLDRPKLEAASAKSKVATGVVPRVARPSGSEPLTVNAISGKEDAPLYLKVRAEAPKSLSREGKGTMHLSFSLDPIHRSHWNNLAPAMKYSLSAPEGITLTPASGEAAKVTAAEADRDPRDFLIEVDLGESREPVQLTVTYFACDDDDRWCKSLTQEFEISWETDRDAGKIQDRGQSSKGGRGGMKGKSKGRRPDPDQFMTRMDLNSDGLIQKDEARGPMIERFEQMDLDGDGAISKDEIKKRFESMAR